MLMSPYNSCLMQGTSPQCQLAHARKIRLLLGIIVLSMRLHVRVRLSSSSSDLPSRHVAGRSGCEASSSFLPLSDETMICNSPPYHQMPLARRISKMLARKSPHHLGISVCYLSGLKFSLIRASVCPKCAIVRKGHGGLLKS